MTLALLVFALCAAATNIPNCRAPGPETPGALRRCDVEQQCGNWCARNHLSLDFLCCDTSGWKAVHATLPMVVFFFTQSLPTSALAVLAVESGEAVALTLLWVPDSVDGESLAESLVADVLLQGGFGIALAWALSVLFEQPAPLLAVGGTRARVLFVVWLLASGLGLAGNDENRLGLFLFAAAYLLLTLVSARYFHAPRHWPHGGYFFAAWALVAALLHASVFVSLPGVANDYYQIWALLWPLTYIALARASVWLHRRGRTNEALAALTFFLALLSLACFVFYRAVASTAQLVCGITSGALTVGVLLYTLLFHRDAAAAAGPGEDTQLIRRRPRA